MTKQIFTTTVLIAALITGLSMPPVKADSPSILITEIQTGYTDSQGVDNPRQEYIEIANISTAAINLTGWRIEYLSAANTGPGATYLVDTISGQISAGGHGMWEHDGYYPIAPDSVFGSGDTSATGILAKSGGHVRIMNGTTMVDCVAWGSAAVIAGCDKVSAVASPGYTLQRRLINGTYSKANGVANLSPATPQGNNIYNVSAIAPVIPPAVNPVQTTSQPECSNLQLSEVLANPAGDDTIGEFIELYNPSDQTQSLHGCSLSIASGKQYAFVEAATIAAHEYKSFPYSTTALQLGNSGGVVTLTTISGSSSTTYPAVGDDESWSLIAGSWMITKALTPSAANLFSQVAVVVAATATASTVTPEEVCPEGKFRNPDTGRCKNIEVPMVAAVCGADQERNPSTGRCRKMPVVAAATTCPAGQEKNPETNRCRKIAQTSVQKPCPAGQERSKDSGRCRKIVAATDGKVLGNKTSKKTYNYLIVGFILSAVVGYGLYEYRQDAANLWRRLVVKVARHQG